MSKRAIACVVSSLLVSATVIAVNATPAAATSRVPMAGHVSCKAITGTVKFSTPVAPNKFTPATATITLRISQCSGTLGTTLPGTLTGVLKATTTLEWMDCQDLTTGNLPGPGSGTIKWKIPGLKIAPSLITWPDYDQSEISWNGFYPTRASFLFSSVSGSFSDGNRGQLGVPYNVVPQTLATTCATKGIKSIKLGSSTGVTGMVL